jgi:hypothetical protein
MEAPDFLAKTPHWLHLKCALDFGENRANTIIPSAGTNLADALRISGNAVRECQGVEFEAIHETEPAAKPELAPRIVVAYSEQLQLARVTFVADSQQPERMLTALRYGFADEAD